MHFFSSFTFSSNFDYFIPLFIHWMVLCFYHIQVIHLFSYCDLQKSSLVCDPNILARNARTLSSSFKAYNYKLQVISI